MFSPVFELCQWLSFQFLIFISWDVRHPENTGINRWEFDIYSPEFWHIYIAMFERRYMFQTISFLVIMLNFGDVTNIPTGFKIDILSIWMFPRIVVPQIILFNRVFHYKPSILGYPYFGNTHIVKWRLDLWWSGDRFEQVTNAWRKKHRNCRDFTHLNRKFSTVFADLRYGWYKPYRLLDTPGKLTWNPNIGGL